MAKTNFEEKLKNLEAIAAKMDSSKLSLDEMIAAFEEGQKLVQECRKDLESIRLKIEKVTSAGGKEQVKITQSGDVDL